MTVLLRGSALCTRGSSQRDLFLGRSPKPVGVTEHDSCGAHGHTVRVCRAPQGQGQSPGHLLLVGDEVSRARSL